MSLNSVPCGLHFQNHNGDDNRQHTVVESSSRYFPTGGFLSLNWRVGILNNFRSLASALRISMSQRDEKARKRARKKAEEAKKKRERQEARNQPPQRMLTDFARSIIKHVPAESNRRQQFELNFELSLRRIQRLPKDESWQEACEHIAKAHATTPGTISCRYGCSACCHQHVGLSTLEAEKIANAMAEQYIPLDEGLLTRQVQAKSWNQLSFADRRCVFLGSEGECRIYEVRPLTCRRYVVTSDPQHCVDEAVDKIQSTLDLVCDAYLSAFLTHYGHHSLPQFLQSIRLKKPS
jgi:Fe-S-cluster containining protein